MSVKMRPIRSKDDIEKVNDTDVCLYIGFRPSSKDLIQIINSAPALKIIYIPESYTKTLSKSMSMLLEMKNIQLMVGGVQNNDNIASCYVLDDSVLDINNPDAESVEGATEGATEITTEGAPEISLEKEENSKMYGQMGQSEE